MKNIHLIILGIFIGIKLNEEKIGHLGESQGYAQVTSPFQMIPKPKSKQGKNQVRKQREGKSGKRGKIQAVTLVVNP